MAANVILPSARVIEAILRELVERFGGVYGVRDLATVAAALLQAEKAISTAERNALFRATAAVGMVLSRSPLPGIADRNLRAAWFTMFVILRINGRFLDARESDATAIVLGIADGSVDEAGLIAFLEANSREVTP